MGDSRAHIVHVVHRFATGGMENGVVNLVNRLPDDRFRHTIVALAGIGTIAERVSKSDVAIESLDLPPGPLLASLPRLWRRFRVLRPSIVHTRNVGTLEAQLAATCAGVAVRVHGEHGWEMSDLVGSNVALLRTRRLLKRIVHAQVALSTPTFDYLRDRVGVPLDRLHAISNGVDTERFRPRAEADGRRGTAVAESSVVIGYVGRLADVKNPLLAIEAFERLHARTTREDAALATRLRLEVIGDGPLAAAMRERTQRSALREAIALAGERADVAERMREFDVYLLPSHAEGISNTLLEAMASGLPCVATCVGGNAELLDATHGGTLVPSGNAEVMAEALESYVRDPGLRAAHGAAARRRAVEHFSIDRMISAYERLYTELLVQYHVIDGTRGRHVVDAAHGPG